MCLAAPLPQVVNVGTARILRARRMNMPTLFTAIVALEFGLELFRLHYPAALIRNCMHRLPTCASTELACLVWHAFQRAMGGTLKRPWKATARGRVPRLDIEQWRRLRRQPRMATRQARLGSRRNARLLGATPMEMAFSTVGERRRGAPTRAGPLSRL